MSKYIHNISGETRTYRGVPIADQAFYLIDPANLVWYQTSSEVLADMGAGDLRMSSDGSSDVSTEIAKNINFLVGEQNPIDTETSGISFTPKYAPTGWKQQIFELEFETSKLNSIHEKDENNNDIGWSSLKFYDSSNVELTTQAAIDTSCVKTVHDWSPTIDFMIKGGFLAQISSPSSDVYVWTIAVPDLAPVVFAQGGINLAYLDAKSRTGLDGVAGSILKYNDPVPGTNVIRTVVRHPAGFKHRIQCIFDMFREP